MSQNTQLEMLTNRISKQKKLIKKLMYDVKMVENRYEQILAILNMRTETIQLWIKMIDRMLGYDKVRTQINNIMKTMDKEHSDLKKSEHEEAKEEVFKKVFDSDEKSEYDKTL